MSDGTADSLDNGSLTRRRGRYDADAVDRLFEQFKGEYQQLWNERERLRRRLDAAEEELGRFREIERNLGNALLVGESAAAELRERATQQAMDVVAEARSRADSILIEARAKADGLVRQAREAAATLQEQIKVSETRLREAHDMHRSFLVEARHAIEAQREQLAEEEIEAVHRRPAGTNQLPRGDSALRQA
jgi:cell division septum initiation protein DivIVA